MSTPTRPLRVCLVAIPDAVISTLSGIYDALGCFAMLSGTDDDLPEHPPFVVEIVAETAAPVASASGLPVQPHRAVAEIDDADIVIVPSLVVGPGGWRRGRYPGLVAWTARMHARGAILCSACSGIFVLAETGLFDKRDATVHWGYADHLRLAFPAVRAAPEQVLVVAGERCELVSSGASTSWHDLVLYLIDRHAGPTAAQAVARFFAMQWHREGLAPYMVFRPPTGHGDAAVAEVQAWLAAHHAVAAPVEEMVRRSGLPARSFKRRFARATGLTPIAYVQRLRIEEAKRRLERTDDPVDEVAWQVGYEEPAFFRRLFKRLAGISPGAYRRGFRVPVYDHGSTGPR